MQLPITLQNKVIDFLKSLPTLHDGDSQRAFIYQAGLDRQLQEQLPIGKPPGQFVPLFVSILLEYGKLKDKKHALAAVLETAKNYIGHDQQLYCDKLLQEFYANTQKQNRLHPKRLKNITKYWASSFIRILLVSIFIVGFIGSVIIFWKGQTKLTGNTLKVQNEMLAAIHAMTLQAKETSSEVDYLEYNQTKAVHDSLSTIAQLSKIDAIARKEALKEMKQLLRQIETEYLKLYSPDRPDLQMERLKFEGTILSHRRQIGTLIAAIESLEPADEDTLVLLKTVKMELKELW